MDNSSSSRYRGGDYDPDLDDGYPRHQQQAPAQHPTSLAYRPRAQSLGREASVGPDPQSADDAVETLSSPDEGSESVINIKDIKMKINETTTLK